MANYPADQIFAPADLIKNIADAGNTPFYLYDKEGIIQSSRDLYHAFSWAGTYQNFFPLRDNLNPCLLSILQKAGSGVSVSNKAELKLALSCGFRDSQLLYEPTQADPEAETMAKEANAIWLINSAALMPPKPPSKIILRYNTVLRPMTSPQRQAAMRFKNGMTDQQVIETTNNLLQQGITEVGLALQSSSYCVHPGFWAKRARTLIQLRQEIQKKTGIHITSLHLGEGPGLPYRPKVDAPNLEDEATSIRAVLEQDHSKENIQLYTGVSRRLLEANGILITKVLEVRPILRTFLIMDAGISQYCRSELKNAYRHVSVLGNSSIGGRKLYYLVGDLPDTIDRLVQKGRMLPTVQPGDYCVVHDVGCHGRSMPLLYGLRPVAAEFLYEADGTISQISPRRTEDEVLKFLTAL